MMGLKYMFWQHRLVLYVESWPSINNTVYKAKRPIVHAFPVAFSLTKVRAWLIKCTLGLNFHICGLSFKTVMPNIEESNGAAN